MASPATTPCQLHWEHKMMDLSLHLEHCWTHGRRKRMESYPLPLKALPENDSSLLFTFHLPKKISYVGVHEFNSMKNNLLSGRPLMWMKGTVITACVSPLFYVIHRMSLFCSLKRFYNLLLKTCGFQNSEVFRFYATIIRNTQNGIWEAPFITISEANTQISTLNGLKRA